MLIFSLTIVAFGSINDAALIKQAKFFSRFERFVDWSAEQNKRSPFIIGIIGRNPFGKQLEKIYANITFTNRPITIKYLTSLEEIINCHILYIAPIENFTIEEILNSSKGKGVFLISFHEGWAEKGVHLNYYIENGKHLKFELNPYTSKRDNIYIDLKLLRLAKIVGDK